MYQMDFTYAHKDTSGGERQTPTAKFNIPRITPAIQAVREEAFKAEIPVSDDETLCFLGTLLTALQPKEILELGTAVGVSGGFMLGTCPEARLTTVERDENFYNSAKRNFKTFGVSERVVQILGDAGEEITKLRRGYDFVFLDFAKVQYVKYLPALKNLLRSGGVLVADDILLFGYVTGERETPKKRKMLVEHVKEYIAAATGDEELITTVINIGNGLAVSVKK